MAESATKWKGRHTKGKRWEEWRTQWAKVVELWHRESGAEGGRRQLALDLIHLIIAWLPFAASGVVYGCGFSVKAIHGQRSVPQLTLLEWTVARHVSSIACNTNYFTLVSTDLSASATCRDQMA